MKANSTTRARACERVIYIFDKRYKVNMVRRYLASLWFSPIFRLLFERSEERKTK